MLINWPGLGRWGPNPSLLHKPRIQYENAAIIIFNVISTDVVRFNPCGSSIYKTGIFCVLNITSTIQISYLGYLMTG